MSSTSNYNDFVIDIEAKLLRDKYNKELLIRESFLLWYIQVEGIHCESFEEKDLKEMQIRNTRIYQQFYENDPDYSFILGWMAGIAFWYFTPFIKEETAILLLRKAFEMDRNNSLFKWAIRVELKLNQNEISGLKTDIILRYDQFYNYGELIKSYFLDVLSSS